MKKNNISVLIIVFTIFCLLSTILGKDAAKLRIVRTIAITPEDEYYLDPKISPDGSKVVFKGRKGGLFIRNADGTGPMITVLLPEKGTNKYIWSPDSKTLAYKRKTGKETKRLSTTLHTFDVQTKQSIVLKSDVPAYGRIRWTKRGIEAKSTVPIKNKTTGSIEVLNKVLNVSTKELRKSNDPIVYYDQIDLKHFVIVEDGNGNVLSKTPGYSIPIMSPTKDKFLASKGHTYVLSLHGDVLADLGPGDRAQWSSDGTLIVYEISDWGGWHGQVRVGSEIYVINADGTGKNQLTNTPDILEVAPNLSKDAGEITYYDDKTGRVYVAELEEVQ